MIRRFSAILCSDIRYFRPGLSCTPLCVLWSGFHANLPTLNQQFLFQENAATIYTIGCTGTMLNVGQERSG